MPGDQALEIVPISHGGQHVSTAPSQMYIVKMVIEALLLYNSTGTRVPVQMDNMLVYYFFIDNHQGCCSKCDENNTTRLWDNTRSHGKGGWTQSPARQAHAHNLNICY